MEARNTGWSSIKLLQFLLHLEHGKDMITTDYNSGEKMKVQYGSQIRKEIETLFGS
jgi:hypothetical protein